MKQAEIYVGIDVAKDRVDVAIRPEGDIWSADYDERGMSELVSCLRTAEPTAVLLEATGGLEVPLVSALAAAALPVVVVNPPRQVRDSAKATGRLAKTDALDAQVLAHFAEAVRPPVRPLRDEDTQEFNSLATRRSQLMTMLVAEKNRLRRASHSVHPSIQSHIRWLEQELSDLDKDCKRLCVVVLYGVRKTTCCARCPVWESSSHCRFWHTSRSWVLSTASGSPLWSAWRLSTGTAGPAGANAVSGAAEPGCARCSTWVRWSPVDTIRCYEPFTNGCWRQGSLRSWR